jgi:large subunit ribosomal protein L7/L12
LVSIPRDAAEFWEREPSAMSDSTATMDFSPECVDLGDKIANLTLKQAKELSDYLKEVYKIEPAAGGGVVMAAMPAGEGGEGAAAAKTEWDVVLTGFGDKKLNVVKVVKSMTGATLMESKKMVESVPVAIKEKVSKEDAEKIKAELEEAGGSVELK